ncbi:hypothetical protein J4G66_03065 [Aeromonas dhakensis]|uniref:hypothetical protein n=1 Tax=Aeromonas dhakensis TaxID=196024 RepID=UPI001BCE5761|nr:hypothetical protein [Aeromonas dhakensis]MBS4714955.1 hypothetical protein [Aeromonas dhakensis]
MHNEDNYQTKLGPTYDSIRAQLLINNQQRTWDMIQHISTVEIATLAAWFYLYDKNELFISAGLILFSIAIVFSLLLSIVRYSLLMQDASASLNRNTNIYLSSSMSFKNAHIPRAATISKAIPIITIAFNFIVLIFNIYKISCHS